MSAIFLDLLTVGRSEELGARFSNLLLRLGYGDHGERRFARPSGNLDQHHNHFLGDYKIFAEFFGRFFKNFRRIVLAT
jgi:hypothetical protein